jgi:hypothetical protein
MFFMDKTTIKHNILILSNSHLGIHMKPFNSFVDLTLIDTVMDLNFYSRILVF